MIGLCNLVHPQNELLLIIECFPVCIKSFNAGLYLVSCIVIAINEVFSSLKKGHYGIIIMHQQSIKFSFSMHMANTIQLKKNKKTNKPPLYYWTGLFLFAKIIMSTTDF